MMVKSVKVIIHVSIYEFTLLFMNILAVNVAIGLLRDGNFLEICKSLKMDGMQHMFFVDGDDSVNHRFAELSSQFRNGYLQMV